jgi:hypothetical protein
MTEKIENFTDPAVSLRNGDQRVYWVPFAADQTFPRRSGKAVDLHTRYRKATANSTNLAGFLVVDAAGVTGGHPASIASADKLAVDFGLQREAVMPTSGRAATEADIGKRFDVAVDGDGVQHIDMSNQSKGVLQVAGIIDDDGSWVGASIPVDKRYGNL